MKNKEEAILIKKEPDEESDQWAMEHIHDGAISNELTIKLEPMSPSNDLQPEPNECKEDEQCTKTEFVMIKLEGPLDLELTEETCTEDKKSCPIKTENDDSESNNTEKKELSLNPKSQYTVKIEVEVTDNGAKPKTETDSDYREDVTEKDKHIFNIKSILESTNATLIRSQDDIGYTCYFCDKCYQNPAELKEHAMQTHTAIEEKDFAKLYVAGYVAKLDITNLHCKLCRSDIDSLENIIAHLNDAHTKSLFVDIKNQILPFKFDSSVHKCCICSKDFNKFRSLQFHVQTHYPNYECGDCNLAFINRMKLLQHCQTHKVGNFTCQYCSKQFNTEFKKKKHERNVHDQSLKVKCGLCNERFKYSRQKELHMTEVHSVEPMNKCHLCDKVYVTQDSLSVHVKRDHLKTRNAKCTECDMSFYLPSQLRVHMVKHTGISQFECKVCHKSYRRKNYYKEHMRVHSNDRRHKCNHCEVTFVHKTSLRYHLRAKHGENLTSE